MYVWVVNYNVHDRGVNRVVTVSVRSPNWRSWNSVAAASRIKMRGWKNCPKVIVGRVDCYRRGHLVEAFP